MKRLSGLMLKRSVFHLMNARQHEYVRKISVIVNERYRPCNDEVPNKQIRLIDDESGKMLGIFEKNSALEIAQEKKKDLLLVSDKVDPIVCKVIDYKELMLNEFKKKMHNLKKDGSMKKKSQTINI